MAAIERLIKRKIDSVLVPGFQPGGTSVAGMMGRQAHSGRREREAGRERHRQPRPAPQPVRTPTASNPPASKPPSDPIFSKPYESGTAPTAPVMNSESPQQSKRKQPQVAALLGGLKRA